MWLFFIVVAVGLSACTKKEPQNSAAAPTSSEVNLPRQTHTGEELFKQYCAVCHPDGGNISDPPRSLHGSVLRANHISTSRDIVRIIRNPRSRMIRFDVATLPDVDAMAIADYILTTFK
jgi:cytochrome c6